MVYIASLNDQVVGLYSGLFTSATHPLILRALYIDGDVYQFVFAYLGGYGLCHKKIIVLPISYPSFSFSCSASEMQGYQMVASLLIYQRQPLDR